MTGKSLQVVKIVSVLMVVFVVAFITISIHKTTIQRLGIEAKEALLLQNSVWINASKDPSFTIPQHFVIAYTPDQEAEIAQCAEEGKTIIIFCEPGCNSAAKIGERILHGQSKAKVKIVLGGIDAIKLALSS